MSDVKEIIRKLRLLANAKPGDILPDELGGPFNYAEKISELAKDAADALETLQTLADASLMVSYPQMYIPAPTRTFEWPSPSDITVTNWNVSAMGCFPHGGGEWSDSGDETDAKPAADTAPSELSPQPVETRQELVDRLWRAVVDASQG